jgi:hypothetical protein
MSLTGAMAQDKDLFESGFIAVHPNDENGRTVVFVDRIRATPPFATRDATVSEILCLFFCFTLWVVCGSTTKHAGISSSFSLICL